MKIYLQLITFLFISISSVFGQYPKTGLVGNYMFSGNASNLAGNNNNGSVYQASLTTDRFGNQNSAYLFDGINDNIDLSNSYDINPRTISFWFYANSISNVVSLYASDNPNLSNGMSAVNLSNTNGLDSIIIQQGFKRARASITTNEWHHVMLVHDGSLDEIYVDCVKLNAAQISVDKSINGLSTTVLGSNRNKMGFNFYGKIDDVRIYNQVLNTQEITALCNEQNSCSVVFTMLPANVKTKGGTSASFNTSSTDNNAQFQWQVNDGNGFTNISNQCYYAQNTPNVLQIPVTPLAWNNNKYRCIISSNFCSDTTNESSLSVDSTVLIYDTMHVVIHDTTHITVNDTISKDCDTLTFYFKLGMNLLDIV